MATDLAFTRVELDSELVDAVSRAGFAVWQYNGRDVAGAILAVHREHVSAVVRDAAGTVYDELLTTPIVWRALEVDFEQRARGER